MRHHHLVLLLVIGLSGCAITPTTGIDGIVCVGQIIPTKEGLQQITDDELLTSTLASSGNGKLCKGKVYKVTRPIAVYRVWNSEKTYTRLGNWWAFDKPQGPRDTYRKEYDICPSWSLLDKMTRCTIKPGSHIVIGTGQSVKCETETYPKSAENQVYIPNDGRNQIYFVDNCSAGTDWP